MNEKFDATDYDLVQCQYCGWVVETPGGEKPDKWVRYTDGTVACQFCYEWHQDAEFEQALRDAGYIDDTNWTRPVVADE